MCDDPTFRGKKNRNCQWENFDNNKKKEKKNKERIQKNEQFFCYFIVLCKKYFQFLL